MKVVCERCGELVDVMDPDQQILNDPRSSVLVLHHPKEGYCFTCKSKVALFLKGAQCMLTARPCGAKPNILVAPASALSGLKS